jgi:hypothetical protein
MRDSRRHMAGTKGPWGGPTLSNRRSMHRAPTEKPMAPKQADRNDTWRLHGTCVSTAGHRSI